MVALSIMAGLAGSIAIAFAAAFFICLNNRRARALWRIVCAEACGIAALCFIALCIPNLAGAEEAAGDESEEKDQELGHARGRIEAIFQISDSTIRGKILPGVWISVANSEENAEEIALGETDQNGILRTELEARRYFASFRLKGYVPVRKSIIEPIDHNKISVSLAPLLPEIRAKPEQQKKGIKRIQLVANWGSRANQARDVDAHLRCPDGTHINFFKNRYSINDFSATLDVDDMDGGGPETITILNPIPGKYLYWISNRSKNAPLGASDLIIRVILDNQAFGESIISEEYSRNLWRPFEAILVDHQGGVSIVENPEDSEDDQAAEDRKPDAGQDESNSEERASKGDENSNTKNTPQATQAANASQDAGELEEEETESSIQPRARADLNGFLGVVGIVTAIGLAIWIGSTFSSRR